MKLIIVRHGETTDNAAKILMGQSPGKLSEKGKMQAVKLGERLAKEKIDYVFSSDLARAADTTKEIIKRGKNRPAVKYLKLLRERHVGELQGKPWEIFKEARGKQPKTTFKPKGGESMTEVHARALKFFRMINAKKYEEKTILVCSHHGFISTLFANILNISIEQALAIKNDNTSVTVIELNHGKAKQVKMNCTEHLD